MHGCGLSKESATYNCSTRNFDLLTSKPNSTILLLTPGLLSCWGIVFDPVSDMGTIHPFTQGICASCNVRSENVILKREILGTSVTRGNLLDRRTIYRHKTTCKFYKVEGFGRRNFDRSSVFIHQNSRHKNVKNSKENRPLWPSLEGESSLNREEMPLDSPDISKDFTRPLPRSSKVPSSKTRFFDTENGAQCYQSHEMGPQQVTDLPRSILDIMKLETWEDIQARSSSVDFKNSLGKRGLLLGAFALGLASCLSAQGGQAETAAKSKTGVSLLEKVGSVQLLEPPQKLTGSRIYDASVLGEPAAIGKDKGRVWQKLLSSRVVYLGEAERVPDPSDKVLELEILRTLRDKCFEQQRPVSLAFQAFPCTLQPQLNQYMSKRLTDNQLRVFLPHWPDERWKGYEPLLQYCRNNGVRLIACGTPPEVLRIVQVKGVQGLNDNDKQKYAPPAGGGYVPYMPSISQQLSLAEILPNASAPNGPGPYRFAQSRMVEDHTMSQIVLQAMADGGSVGLLVVITGATHVLFGSKGSGLPARITNKLQKRTQVVVLLNPERQRIRNEGDVPVADFLWYSLAKPCVRNCFDRAEVARVMDAAGRRRDALPKDLQTGLDLGLVSPEVLKDFLDLEQNPFVAELTHHFQGFRERWLADPHFLRRLAIEEAISISTTIVAQYERRKERFLEELDYVITDTLRGAVVDFFTVWLPAPTLTFRSSDSQATSIGAFEGLKGLLGSIPDNAFQRATAGENWDFKARLGAVVIGGFKLFFVGFISSLGTVTASNAILNLKQRFNPEVKRGLNKPSPVLKTAVVYGSFLGASANLRYQVIAGVVEHWVADYFLASHPLAGDILSFVTRTANSFWGTQQWVDLARSMGLQTQRRAIALTAASQIEVKPETCAVGLEIKLSSSDITPETKPSSQDS